VAKETAAQLQVGMSRAQVRDLLGSPLVTDMFHTDRWDYVFYIQHGPTAVVQRRTLTVYFAGDKLTHWTDTGNLLSEKQLLEQIDTKGKKKLAK
jgi:outer membrane protein assembly factor BamE